MNQYTPPPHTGLDIIFQDEHLIVVNKPSGLLSVPGRGADKQDCMSARVQLEFPDTRVVHRLDMETSGIMLMARSSSIQAQMGKLFQNRDVEKIYSAIVHGQIREAFGEISLPLMADWPNRPRQKVDYLHGKQSITQYRVRAHDKLNNTTDIDLYPLTGRSHQLRVHLFTLGHAILGDTLYPSNDTKVITSRLMLHARLLGFFHPITSKRILLECETPF